MSIIADSQLVGYNLRMEQRSKTYILVFLLTGAFAGLFRDFGFGTWWFAVVPIGMFTVCLLYCAPVSIVAWLFERQRVLFLPSLLELGGLIAFPFATLAALQWLSTQVN